MWIHTRLFWRAGVGQRNRNTSSNLTGLRAILFVRAFPQLYIQHGVPLPFAWPVYRAAWSRECKIRRMQHVRDRR